MSVLSRFLKLELAHCATENEDQKKIQVEKEYESVQSAITRNYYNKNPSSSKYFGLGQLLRIVSARNCRWFVSYAGTKARRVVGTA